MTRLRRPSTIERRRQRGVGLLEMLAALVLLALMLALIPGALELVGRFHRTRADFERAEATSAALRSLDRWISSAVPVNRISSGGERVLGMEGRGDAISFVAAAPQSMNIAGLASYRLALVSEPQGRASNRNLAVIVVPLTPDARQGLTGDDKPTILVENVSGLSLRYFGVPHSGPGPASWRSTWPGLAGLPALVEITIETASAGGWNFSGSPKLTITIPVRQAQRS